MIDRACFQQSRSQISESFIDSLLLNQFDIEVPFCGIVEIESQNTDGEHELAFKVESEGGGGWFEGVVFLAEPSDGLLVDQLEGISSEEIKEDGKDDDGSEGARYGSVHGAVFVPEVLGQGEEVEDEEECDEILFATHFKYIYSYTTTDLASQIYNYHFFAESFAFLVKILFAGTPLKRFLG